MNRTFSNLALALVVCAAAQAATISTTLTVNATATPSVTFTSFAIAGTVSMTGGIGTGKFASTVPLDLTALSVVADYTITLDAGGTLTGKLTVPLSILQGGTAEVTVTVANGTGTYINASSGTSPITLTGNVSGDIASGFKLTNFTSGSFTITTGGTPPPPVPTITAVLDSASSLPDIAPGSIFIVKGSNLAPSGFTAFSVPRPLASNGLKINFTPVTGGGGWDAILWYLCNSDTYGCVGDKTQLAAILPSAVPPGSYNVTVTNGTVSAPFVARVVASKIGVYTQDSTGTGQAVVQNIISASQYDLNRLTTGSVNGTTISPAHPGQAMIAYGTGLGAYPDGDNASLPSHDFKASETILAVVGGVNIPVGYAGLAGYSGEDAIAFTLPANIPTGCAVPFQISVNGTLSAPTTISIAPDANSSACVMPGFTAEQLKKFDNGGTYTSGAFSISQFSITDPQLGSFKSDSIAGSFSQLTGYQLASAAQVNPSVFQSGSCQVIHSAISGTSTLIGSLTGLDAGAVTITGPAGSSLTNQALKNDGSNNYSISHTEGISLPGQTSFSIVAGDYTLTGAGGKDVGSFSTKITLASPITVTNFPTSITESAGLTLNWTGGNSSDQVEIFGSSGTTTGTGASEVIDTTTFICRTTAGPGTFTVPASILTQLPKTATGSLVVASGGTPSTFTTTLKAGGSIDNGSFGSFLGIGGSPAYQ